METPAGVEKTQETSQSSSLKLSEDFSSVYANNMHYEPSVWDFKIIFGQLDQHTGNAQVDWHTAVTFPWTQAKIFLYYLSLNVANHEIRNGKIRIPQSVIPTVPPPNKEETEKDPVLQQVYELALKTHSEIFS